MLTLKSYGQDIPIGFVIDHYTNNGNLFVGMVTDMDGYNEPWNDLTVNLDILCEPDCAYVDVNNNEGIIAWLVENGLGSPTGSYSMSGFCTYPEFRFNLDEIKKHLMDD